MMTATATPTTSVSTVRLTLLHAKYAVLETVRVPIAVIGTLVFPALALLFFVVPQRTVAEHPEWATQSIVAMAVFAIITNSLFSFGLTIAENREKPWDPFLRTLPAPGIARVFAQVMATGMLGILAIVPVIIVGGLFTAASVEWWRVLTGLVALAAASLPFMLMGAAIGYAMPFKAAVAVIQVVMFAMAFVGGLFLPPALFADWLDRLSQLTPARQAREFVIWATQGGELAWWTWVGLIIWTIIALILALVLFKRDEGRRYR